MQVQQLNAVLIDSGNGERLAMFYRDRLGIPLVEERHGSELHWGCFLAGLHFAIHHRPETVKISPPRTTAISFAVADVDAAVAELRQHGVPIQNEPREEPFGRLAAIRDPDGNLVYLHKYPEH